VRARAVLRRVVPAAAATAAVVALLASVRSRPPNIAVGAHAPPPPRGGPAQPEALRVSSRRPTVPGPTRSATSDFSTTPFSVIAVRVTLTGRQLTRVQTVALGGTGARTQAINDHAEPILREEALEAGSAKIDVVSGATYTSESYIHSVQQAIDRARARR
jgi:FMN-binding domain